MIHSARNNKMGLSNVTMFTDTQYAFSLIVSEAVILRKKNGGGWLVSSSKVSGRNYCEELKLKIIC